MLHGAFYVRLGLFYVRWHAALRRMGAGGRWPCSLLFALARSVTRHGARWPLALPGVFVMRWMVGCGAWVPSRVVPSGSFLLVNGFGGRKSGSLS